MKRASAFAAAVAGLMLALTVAPMTVLAGTEDAPEITDVGGDATNGRSDMDIVKAWVEGPAETNTTLTFRILMTSLNLFSPRSDWQSLPQVLYDYYFTFKGYDYAARARIPVHGPLAAFAGFGLYKVDYGATSENLTFTAADGTVTGSYNSGGTYVEMTVYKENIGGPVRGDLITHMWAAVYYQPRGQDMQRIDTAMSYKSPGRDYLVKGEFNEFYDVRLQVANSTMDAAPRVPARFNITIRSTSSVDIFINLTNTTPPIGYKAIFSKNDTGGIHVPANSSVTLFLTVNVPDNATNGTDVPIMVSGKYQTRDRTNIATNNLNLIVQVRFIPPKPPVKQTTIFTFIADHAVWLGGGLVAIAIILVIWYVVGRKSKRQEADDLVAFAAYVEAQKRSREAGAGDVERASPP